MDPNGEKLTRYEGVKKILEEAAGNSKADYQGYGRFWNLPLAQFLNVKICGVAMVAPAGPAIPCGPAAPQLPVMKAGSCCHGEGKAEAPAPAPQAARQPGRGAASGLIAGLRGQWPFDDVLYPRLPWGGTPVSASDIQFISDWIDDGCPEADAVALDRQTVMALASGQQAHAVVSENTNAFKAQANEVKIRQNVEHLSDTELCELRYAIAELIQLNRWPRDMRNYNSWAQLHGDECPHGWSTFLPWHRMYLWGFEQALQDIVPTVTLPYWNWSASTPEQIKEGYIPDAYRCRVDESVLRALSGKVSAETIAKLKAVEGEKFTSITKLW